EHPAQPGVTALGIDDIGESEEQVILAGANPEMMPVMRIRPGRNRRWLIDLRAGMRRTEAPLDRGGACDEIAAAHASTRPASGNDAS
ncbi:hypothetical protein QUT02_22615, partial [Xanthomonas citri pv. citri]